MHASSMSRSSHRPSNSRWLSIALWMGIISCILAMLLSGCKKDGSDPPSTPGGGGNAGTTRVFGTVQDRSGAAVAGAQVFVGGQTASTDARGVFMLSSVSTPSRCFVRAEKAGFFPGSEGTLANIGGTTRVDITLVPSTPSFNFSTSTANNATLSNGANVFLPANSLATASGQPVTGNVQVAVVHLDPMASDFTAVTPGGDLLGSNADGQRQLYSYGMLMVRITDSGGNEVNLASGSTATVTMPVPASQLASAPASVPLWHFNETTGIWVEEGSASLQGSSYVGTVTHFSTWNADIPGDRAVVRGFIRDCNGQPLEGVRVITGQSQTVTNSSGGYERFVPTGISFTVQVNEASLGLQSAIIPVPALSNDQQYTLPDINVACPGYLTLDILCTTGGLSWGTVHADWGSGDLLIVYAATGQYRIAAPTTGASATLTVLRPNGTTQTQTVSLPTSAGQSVSAGSFDVCPPGTSGGFSGGFTINGDGFSNVPFTQSANSQTAYCVYTISDDASVGFIVGTGGTSISFGAPGNSTGSWPIVDGSGDGFVSLGINGNSYTSNNATFNITQFGPVGGTVSGNFSGEFARFDQVTFELVPVTITNGTFSVFRAPDEP